MASKEKESEKRKRVNLRIEKKLELIKKLVGSFGRPVCDENGVKKQTVTTFGGLKINSQVMQ